MTSFNPSIILRLPIIFAYHLRSIILDHFLLSFLLSFHALLFTSHIIVIIVTISLSFSRFDRSSESYLRIYVSSVSRFVGSIERSRYHSILICH